MASHHLGLCSGELPPEPILEEQTPQMTIHLQARPNAQEVPTSASTAARGGIPEADPPDYTK